VMFPVRRVAVKVSVVSIVIEGIILCLFRRHGLFPSSIAGTFRSSS
jgi:hypothetical protein